MALRLSRAAATVGEFLAETILNLSKSLEVLFPPSGDAKTMFVEAAMKDGLGFYSGQLSQFAIVRDEEPHRPVYLIDVWFKKDRDDLYVAVEADGVLLDLADVSTLLIKQMDLSNPLPVPDLKP